jgi:hypothetical protein
MEGQPLLESDQQDDLSIPSWDNLCAHYESRWAKEKEKFQNQLKMHFKALVERFACGKQELYSLCVADRLEKKYIRAFLEIFESGYAPHVGDVERIANKKVRKPDSMLYAGSRKRINLPH